MGPFCSLYKFYEQNEIDYMYISLIKRRKLYSVGYNFQRTCACVHVNYISKFHVWSQYLTTLSHKSCLWQVEESTVSF